MENTPNGAFIGGMFNNFYNCRTEENDIAYYFSNTSYSKGFNSVFGYHSSIKSQKIIQKDQNGNDLYNNYICVPGWDISGYPKLPQQ